MKRLMIITFVVAICSNAMAGISDDFDSVYDDLLQFLSFRDSHSETLLADQQAASADDTATSDIDSYLFDSELPIVADPSATQLDPGQSGSGDSATSVIANPEPCSIILSSIGLGIAGYLKRRRTI
jgi:hypothetical protein